MKQHHTTLSERKYQQLRHLFPETFIEGKINWQKLKTILQPHLTPDEERERYGLNWVGKQQAYQRLNIPPTQTLEPCREASDHFDTTQHIFIEGENLETLKILEKSYYGRIKMIYIDPPYNTGNDFIYKDRFQETRASYQLRNGELNGHGEKNYEDHLTKNTQENGHYHSTWLSMIYPRLFLARNLLRDDGVIFVSIDDHEVHNLRLVMDEIFGEENFVGQFMWMRTSTPPSLSAKIRKKLEYVLCYEKFINPSPYCGEETEGNDMPLLNRPNKMCVLTFPKKHVVFKFDGFYRAGNYGKVKLLEDLVIKSGKAETDIKLQANFKWRQKNLDTEIERKTTFIIKTTNFSIRYLKEGVRLKKPSNLISKEECGVGTNEEGKKILESHFQGRKVMEFTKPPSLIKYLTKICTQNSDLILDFFAGSGTTAQAVMELNAEDGGNRQYICVQLPERCDEASEAYKAGYKTIAAIAQERIRRASQKIAREHPNYKGDLGYKAFKQVPSHFIPWDGNLPDAAALLAQLKKHQKTGLKPGTTHFPLLYELLLQRGYPLNSIIIHQDYIYQVQHPDRDETLLFLLEKVDESTLDLLLTWKPKPVSIFILDDVFQCNDCLKTNISLQLRDADILFESF